MFFNYAPYILEMMAGGPGSFEILTSTDLKKQANEFKCTVIFFTGRQDYNIVLEMVQDYYNSITASYKKMYWFDKSAHFPNFEERELFQKIMIDEILLIVKSDSIHKEFTEFKGE